MAAPSPVQLPLTGDALIDAALHGYHWQLDGSRTIRWAVSGGMAGEYWTNPNQVAAQMASIFSSISYYANVNFSYAGVYSTPVNAAPYSDITIFLSGSTAIFPSSSTWARAFFPRPERGGIEYPGAAGDVFLNINSQANALSSYAPGSAGYFVFLHEIGHALGLKHPHDDGGTGHPTLSQIGHPTLDKDWFSIMSYKDDYGYNQATWDPATPMPMDVLALQYLYGKNMTTNATDTNYALSVSNLYATLWDAGGRDTIDLSASNQGWVVALPEIQLSRLVDTKIGLAMLANEVEYASPTTFYWLMGDMENITGSRFTDALAGSSGNNLLRGGGGNDFLDGLGGTDYALYDSVRSNYTVTKTNTGITVSARTGSDGVDTLVNIERVFFSNVTLAFDGTGAAGYRLYRAAFDRTPDTPGLGYWIAQLDRGLSLQDVAWNFINSVEFQQKYGANLSNEGFITALYNNVLHRAPDANGLAYWTGVIQGGYLTRHGMLAEFSESPENIAQVIGSTQNGVEYIQFA